MSRAQFVVIDIHNRDIVEIKHIVRRYLKELLDMPTIRALNAILKADHTSASLAAHLAVFHRIRVANSRSLRRVEDDTRKAGCAVLVRTVMDTRERAADPETPRCSVLLCDPNGRPPRRVNRSVFEADSGRVVRLKRT